MVRRQKLEMFLEMQELEIKQLDKATQLYEDGFFSHSILESFKVLITHLSQKLIDKGVRLAKDNIELVIQAQKKNIILKEDLAKINQLIHLRNIAIHSYSQITQEQATTSIDFVKKIVEE